MHPCTAEGVAFCDTLHPIGQNLTHFDYYTDVTHGHSKAALKRSAQSGKEPCHWLAGKTRSPLPGPPPQAVEGATDLALNPLSLRERG